jgi:hypothetical protein
MNTNQKIEELRRKYKEAGDLSPDVAKLVRRCIMCAVDKLKKEKKTLF